MLTVMSVWALIRVGNGSAPVGHLVPTGSWFNPFAVKHFSDFVVGLADMLFIYWGWDTAVACNEETADAETVPGRRRSSRPSSCSASTRSSSLAVQSFAGIGSSGIGLGNSANVGDVLSILGPAIFGHSTLASILDHLLVAHGALLGGSLDADDHPADRPHDAFDGGLQGDPAVVREDPQAPSDADRLDGGHGRWSRSLLYGVMNYLSAGQVIKDSVDSLGVMIAFYYGLTGFSCTWYYRKNLTSSLRNFFMQGVFPTIGGLILFFILGWSFWYYWQPVNSYTHWGIAGQQVGGVFILDVGMLVLGIILMFVMQAFRPAFFRGETLNRDSATLVTEDFLAKKSEADTKP